jgi:alpha-tubulin suppressor-like RCC1 family protein
MFLRVHISKLTLAAGAVTTISAGGDHTCAMVTGGSLLCWGDNKYGGVGIGTTSNQYIPIAVGLGSGIRAPTQAVQNT